MCLPDGEAVQWCEVTKPGLVGMLFGLPTLGSFGRVLRVTFLWIGGMKINGSYIAGLRILGFVGKHNSFYLS